MIFWTLGEGVVKGSGQDPFPYSLSCGNPRLSRFSGLWKECRGCHFLWDQLTKAGTCLLPSWRSRFPNSCNAWSNINLCRRSGSSVVWENEALERGVTMHSKGPIQAWADRPLDVPVMCKMPRFWPSSLRRNVSLCSLHFRRETEGMQRSELSCKPP